MSTILHIVCLDAPSPPDYGGAIDMYYKIKSLSEQGVHIILHYFEYKQGRNTEGLEEYCYKVIAYKRKVGLAGVAINKPYIISSRINKQLIENLNKDHHPILFEGLHCTGVLPFLQMKDRKLIIRVHNDEAIYYRSLARSERNMLRRTYYCIESKWLERYQQTLPDFCEFAFLSETDKVRFEGKYQLQSTHYIPCFLPWQNRESLEGIGSYGLYHGNLSVAENHEAVVWLIENVFSKVDYPFIIAGKCASRKLLNIVEQYAHISIISNPSALQMDELVRHAHVHVLPSLNRTGVKLKLLHVVFKGRFCITNKNGVQGSGLERACILAESADDFIQKINALKQAPFTQKETVLRQELLQSYNNETNALRIMKLLNDADIV